MPTYVYACDSCHAQFEQFQSFKDEPIRTCPACASAVRRVFQPVGIVFKGSGWYITDSRKNNGSNGSSSDAPAKTKSDDATTKTEAKGDVKVDSTSESKSEPRTETKSEPKSDTKTSAPAPAS